MCIPVANSQLSEVSSIHRRKTRGYLRVCRILNVAVFPLRITYENPAEPHSILDGAEAEDDVAGLVK